MPVIDLHLHTNASDGVCGPDELMRRATDAGLRIVSVTDHDTMAGVPRAMDAAADCGLQCVAGIEITAVLGARDVHVLGYFLDPASSPLRDFLASLRADRIRRARRMAERLADLGCPIDIDAVLRDAGGSDYHGQDLGRHAALGSVSVPVGEFERLRARADTHST